MYVATLFATALFQLEGLRWVVANAHIWLANSLQAILTLPVQGWIYWSVMVFVTILVIIIIKFYIVDPLELHANDTDSRGWQVYTFAFLSIGFFLYILNLNFSQPMPAEFPEFLIKALDGTRNTPNIVINSSSESNFYSIFPWIWQLGPIIFMYYYANQAKNAPAKE